MKCLWRFFSRSDLAFWLLVAAGVILFGGALFTDAFETTMKTLNFTLFPVWLADHAAEPWLYAWILGLFVVLFLLAVNTVVCTLQYIRKANLRRPRQLGITIFHCCFLLFLLGHVGYEFASEAGTLTVRSGQTITVPGSEHALTVRDVVKDVREVEGETARFGITVKLVDPAGTERIVQTLHPLMMDGRSFHVAMNDKGLHSDEVRLIVRREPGLTVFALAALLCVVGVAFWLRGSLWRRPTMEDADGEPVQLAG